MKFQHFTPENFSNIEEENISELKPNMYTDVHANILLKDKYDKCSQEVEIICDDLNKDLLNKQNDLLTLEEQRNQSNIEYNTCDAKNKSCKLLYNDIQLKTKEYTDVFNNINELKENMNKCDTNMKKCKLIDENIDKIEKQIKDLDKSLLDLKNKLSNNKC